MCFFTGSLSGGWDHTDTFMDVHLCSFKGLLEVESWNFLHADWVIQLQSFVLSVEVSGIDLLTSVGVILRSQGCKLLFLPLLFLFATVNPDEINTAILVKRGVFSCKGSDQWYDPLLFLFLFRLIIVFYLSGELTYLVSDHVGIRFSQATQSHWFVRSYGSPGLFWCCDVIVNFELAMTEEVI